MFQKHDVENMKCFRNVLFKLWNDLGIIMFKIWNVSEMWRSKHEMFQKPVVQTIIIVSKTWRFKNWNTYFKNVTFKIILWNVSEMWRFKKWNVSEMWRFWNIVWTLYTPSCKMNVIMGLCGKMNVTIETFGKLYWYITTKICRNLSIIRQKSHCGIHFAQRDPFVVPGHIFCRFCATKTFVTS